MASQAHAMEKRQQRQKDEIRRLEAALVRKGVGVLNAAAQGAMTRLKVPNSFHGFPWKLGVWTIATIAEVMSRGMLQQSAAAISESTMAIYTHDAVASGTLVAGEGDGGEF